MNHTDPTYLRTIHDGLLLGTIHKDYASNLPIGLIGMYEQALPPAINVNERKKFLEFFSVWALLKKEVSAAFVAMLLEGWTEEQVYYYISQYSNWFNSPVSGSYVLYHERFRSYIMMRASAKAIAVKRINLIEILTQSIKNEHYFEYRDYAFNNLLYLLGINDLLNDKLSTSSKKLLMSDDYWESAYLNTKNINSLQSQIIPFIWFVSRNNDWELLGTLIKKSDSLLSLNANFATKLCLDENKIFNDSDIETIYENFYDVNYKLKFLLFYSIIAPPAVYKKIKDIWANASATINYKQVDLLKSANYWAVFELNANQELKDSINDLVNEFLYQFKVFKKRSIKLITQSICSFQNISTINLNQILNNEILDRKELYKSLFDIYPSDNLMERDDLITRDTLIFIKHDLNEKLINWIFWLLTESEFEQGPHCGWDTPNAFLILFDLILKSDQSIILNINNRMENVRLDHDSKLYIRSWFSQRLFEQKMKKAATSIMCDFALFSESEFDSSAHLLAYVNSISKPPRKLIKLLEPEYLFEVKRLSVNFKLKALERMDPISKCEYTLELALQIAKSDNNLANNLIESAAAQAKSVEGWGGLWTQLAVLSSSLFLKDTNWIVKYFGDIKRAFRKPNQDLDNYELAIEELFSTHKTRFSAGDNYNKILNEYDFVYRYFKRKYPDLLNKLEERGSLVFLIRNEALNVNSISELWERIKVPFRKFLKLENDFDFWSYIEPFSQLFISFKKKDFKIVNRIVKKTEVRFPWEKFVEFNSEIEMYRTQFHIPDPWQLGKKEGLEGLAVHYKNFSDLDREVIIAAALDGDSVFIANNDSHKDLMASPFAFALQIGINQPNSVAKLNNLVEFRGDLLGYVTV
jgi:hypothetical protein